VSHVPTDFLSRLVALTNFMRLSSLKAAHVVVGECSVQEIRVASAYVGRERRGEAPQALTYFGCFSSKLPQKRHPERSAPQIYRVTQPLVARSRRTPTVLVLPMLFGAFRPPKPGKRLLLRHPLDGHGYIFSCTVILFHPQVWQFLFSALERQWRVRQVRASWLKSSERHG